MIDPLFVKRIQHIADAGKLECSCGNRIWLQFLYVEADNTVIAGCKKCGATYKYIMESKMWIQTSNHGMI